MIDNIHRRMAYELFIFTTIEFHDSILNNMVLYGNEPKHVYTVRKLINNMTWNLDVEG
jgi:hypothetical protein